MFRGKKYKESAKQIDRGTLYDPKEGLELVCKTASAKFKRMELPYPLEHMEQPGPERMESLRRRVSSRGLLVTIGG